MNVWRQMLYSKTVSLQELLEDARRVLRLHGRISRELYRKHGTFKESNVYKFFSNFSDFNKAVQDTEEPLAAESNEFTANSWNIKLDGTPIHTLEELVEYCKIDLTIWEVERFIVNTWQMGYKDQVGNAQAKSLYQVKAVLSKKTSILDARQAIEDLKTLAKESAHWPEVVIKSQMLTDNSLELLIPDLHAGKFSWGRETGHQDYDTPTAIATYERAVGTILERASGYVFDEIVLGVGNDLLNSDDYNSQTTKGTLVSSDTRYQKTYKAVREMLVRTIERLRKHCNRVVVKVIPGNHDTQSTFTLGDSLDCYFHNYDDVIIDNEPSPSKFYRWGKVLLGFCHGDKGKKSDYGIWMATEMPRDFGETLFREVHIGHTHGLKVDEKFGVRVRTFAALCPPDAWHSAEHFTSNLRQAEAIVWNKDQGRIAEFIHTEID